MPGILPMKVIKVGQNAQSRIAQACDRCRSKKIRCDGIRPCCSQCASVGFNCQTSDKLSRRAFPRGYTESLEERVRSLEGEIRELKDLLEEREEKIDMLSKMHSNRRPSLSSAVNSPISIESKKEATPPPKEDVFRVQASPQLQGAESRDQYFMGPSSGMAFVDALKRRIQESGKSLAGLNMSAYLNVKGNCSAVRSSSPLSNSAPPRIFSDRCVNIFFQEWAPLFPVLHKPTFLRLYEEFISDPTQVTNRHKLAQLYLVFGIAGVSSDIPDREHIAYCEEQWKASLDAILMENTLATLQCLILALLYCISKSDYNRLQHYKGIAVGLSHRLGLHQNQKRFSFGALTMETRKKVFWTLYTVDCFSAALLGLPKLLKEEDIHAEYPSDTDDEYVTEKGFQPTLPGEYTKISSALALFRASRILSKVLDQNYPAATTHELSLQSLDALEAELNEWSDKLPTHLKLTFVQDKPSTDITGSRSALLSLAFYYIRSLIHRPAVGSSLGEKASPSVMSLAKSSKHIIQIVQLLEERNMSFSFCLNKNEMLSLCGLSLLYQCLDLKQDSKLRQDGERQVEVVLKYLEKGKAPGYNDFKKLTGTMLSKGITNGDARIPAPISAKPTPSPPMSKKNIQPGTSRHYSASMSEQDLLAQQEKLRLATLPNLAKNHESMPSMGRSSTEPVRHDPAHRPDVRRPSQLSPTARGTLSNQRTNPNLDYFALGNTPADSQANSPQSRPHTIGLGPQPLQTYQNPQSYENSKSSAISASEWEALLGSLDAGQTNMYDAIYGGPAISLPSEPSRTTPSTYASSSFDEWSPESWDMTSLSMNDLSSHQAQSVLSFSEESLSSGEDLSASEMSNRGLDCSDQYLLEGLDATFGL
ncbi:fungal-specific transcription factor-containing protein [Coleophoma crateriformis]|uniref:Fungal-specific transcription factor-containing protein n=1 Tax=Coleophoma crateriformis TaxID=565419 RepID=A0A3D8QMD0_9HELO|nr:fungal-specific transcription factor-containing protein [Coleophoma crateriformis]